MRKSISLILTLGMLCSSLSPVYSKVDAKLEEEIDKEYQAFQGHSILGLKQQPCRAIQFVYHLQDQLHKEQKDCKNIKHTADKIAAIISEGAGVGGIDTSRQATEDERKIAYGALYEAIDVEADIPTLTLEVSSHSTLKEHQRVVHSIYLSKRDSKLSLESLDLLKDDNSYRSLTQSSQEHSEQYLKNLSSLERYLKKTKVLELFIGEGRELLTQTLRKSLTKYIIKNNNKWIDPQDLKVAEQFLWNLYDEQCRTEENIHLVKLLFGNICRKNWNDFKFLILDDDGRIEGSEKLLWLSIYLKYFNLEEEKDFSNLIEDYKKKHNPWRGPYDYKHLSKIFRSFPNLKERQNFLSFCNPYLEKDSVVDSPSAQMVSLLKIYQFFTSVKERQDFLDFCKPYQVKHQNYALARQLKSLLSIYRDFSNIHERQKFLDYAKSYLSSNSIPYFILESILPPYKAFPDSQKRQKFFNFFKSYIGPSDTPYVFPVLLSIYQRIPTDQERQEFLNFCQPYIELEDGDIHYILSNTLSIYQAFPDSQKRQEFLNFCQPYIERPTGSLHTITELLPIYQAFPNSQKRQEFLNFCQPYVENASFHSIHRRNIFAILLQIYQNSEMKENFPDFMKRFYFLRDNFMVINSYSTNLYLRYMRIHAALCPSSLKKDEFHPSIMPTIDPQLERLYQETDLDSYLPAIYVLDPNFFLIQNRTVTNAHEFDAIYELDRELLWKETAGYQVKKGTKSLTIYNNQNKQDNYHTNKEVEDFIQYLDEELVKMEGKVGSSNLAPVKALDVVKQMLGLVKKGEGTTGGFAPYLGHSMYYAKPDSPQGDEMLGRVWLLMKTKAKEKKDEDLKKAVVVAILEAAEVSTSQIDTHCQTRMTGELMKLVSYQFPKQSKLYPLIAAADLPEAQTEDDIQNRIISAPVRAQQLFKKLKKEDSGNIRRVIDNHINEDGTNPELWECYEAYYDDLYRRTKNENGKGYKLDENILKRDDHGNLVSFYQADGSERETPQIVYYQAEFQVFEKTFTNLMRQEFEEQRGLKY